MTEKLQTCIPTGKVAYESKAAAIRAQHKMRSAMQSAAVYKCEYCGTWHLGRSQPKKRGFEKRPATAEYPQ